MLEGLLIKSRWRNAELTKLGIQELRWFRVSSQVVEFGVLWLVLKAVFDDRGVGREVTLIIRVLYVGLLNGMRLGVDFQIGLVASRSGREEPNLLLIWSFLACNVLLLNLNPLLVMRWRVETAKVVLVLDG